MIRLKKIEFIWLLVIFLILSSAQNEVMAASAPDIDTEMEDILLSFSYPSVGRVFVLGMYDYEAEKMYLPAVEVFSLLGIYVEPPQTAGLLSGTFLIGGEPYKIDYRNYSVSVGDKELDYSADMMRERPSDVYLAAEVFLEMFDMEFSYNLNTLSLSLQTPHIMPIVDRTRRTAARERIRELTIQRSFYPLEYGRDRSVLNGGFMDYSIGMASQLNNRQQGYNLQAVGGIEALGGEVRFSNSTAYTENSGWVNRQGNINWTYSVRDVASFSRLQAGQINTRGLQSQQINGISITNNPIEPRQLYGETVFDGTTEPDAEVELYLNNELIDFTLSDSQGYYRFNVPLRYGTTRLRTQVYTTDGQLKINEKELQVPFTFLPKGNLTYNAQAGFINDSKGLQDFGEDKAANVDVSYGLTNWLTTKIGMEYNDADLAIPSIYGSASVRVMQQYLVNLEMVPSSYYRAQTSAVFSSKQSISGSYTYFDGQSRFNRSGADHQFSANVYSPLPFLQAGLRLSADYVKRAQISDTRFRADLFSRLGPLNLRVNYSDRLTGSGSDLNLTGGAVTGAVTYTIRGRRNFSLLSGSFLRSSVTYSRLTDSIDQYDIQFSKNMFSNSRISVAFNRIVPSGISFLQFGLNIDLGGLARSTTTGRTNFSDSNLTQTLRGSVGYDSRFNDFQLSDRQQVGRAGASVILFIDNDNTGHYTEGDEIIPYPAIKLSRSSRINVSEKGIIRINQLQSDYRYNIEIDRSKIPDPLLIPSLDQFSFIADPNQYKTIEIPFYRAGVIEGLVYTLIDGREEEVGGLRLTIKGKDRDFEKNIRTFRDGRFYALDIPPGSYTLEVDPAQLAYIGVVPRDGIFEFEIKATSEGDYLEDLDIVLVQ